jgi:hypothetical protein
VPTDCWLGITNRLPRFPPVNRHPPLSACSILGTVPGGAKGADVRPESPARNAAASQERLKAAYRRHAVKTVTVARPIIGLRAAAFLTAGIAGVPCGGVVAADCGAALVGVTVIFWLA